MAKTDVQVKEILERLKSLFNLKAIEGMAKLELLLRKLMESPYQILEKLQKK